MTFLNRQTTLPKEFRRLAGFGKTNMLQPGESQNITVSFDLYQLASYDETRSAWILEKGTYGIWAGNSLDTAVLAGSVTLDEEVVMIQCEPICIF